MSSLEEKVNCVLWVAVLITTVSLHAPIKKKKKKKKSNRIKFGDREGQETGQPFPTHLVVFWFFFHCETNSERKRMCTSLLKWVL